MKYEFFPHFNTVFRVKLYLNVIVLNSCNSNVTLQIGKVVRYITIVHIRYKYTQYDIEKRL